MVIKKAHSYNLKLGWTTFIAIIGHIHPTGNRLVTTSSPFLQHFIWDAHIGYKLSDEVPLPFHLSDL